MNLKSDLINELQVRAGLPPDVAQLVADTVWTFLRDKGIPLPDGDVGTAIGEDVATAVGDALKGLFNR